MRKQHILIGLLCVAGLAMGAGAAPMVAEPFAYAGGSIHGQAGGSGFAGPWQCSWTGGDPVDTYPSNVELAPGLEFTGYQTEGLAAWSATLGYPSGHPAYGKIANATRPLAGPIATRPGAGSESTVYVGYLYRHSGSQVRAAWQGIGLHADGSLPTYGVTIGLRSRSLSSGQFGINVGSTNSVYPAPNHQGFVDWTYDNNTPANGGSRGTTYFLLAKLVFQGDDGTVDAYLNVYEDGQALPTGEPASWQAHAWRDGVSANWDSQLEMLSVIGTPYSTSLTGANYDEIRVGTSVADVLLVPEPASLALLALGGLLLRRRR